MTRRSSLARFAGNGTGVLTIVVVLPLLVLAVRLAAFGRSHLFPFSDVALIELNVRDVGRHAVLTGPYSRFGWHHLGPAMFYGLALPYRLLGSSSAALYAGAALWNAVMVVGIAVLAQRRGGASFARWTLVVLALYLAVLSPAVLSSPWNPLLVLLAFVAVVMMAWSLALGDITMLPWIAGVGSFVAESHIGDLAAVAIAVAFGLIGCAFRRLPSRRWMSAGAIAVIVLAVMWVPTAIDQASDPGGNLSDVASWFNRSTPDHGLGQTTPVVARELGAIPARTVGAIGAVDGRAEGGARDTPWPFGVLTVAALVGASGLAWRRRARDALVFCALNSLLIAASVLVLARVDGPLNDYLTIWTAGVGVTAWLAVAAAMTSPEVSNAASGTPRARYASAVAIAIICVISAGNVVAAVTTDAPTTAFSSRSVDHLAARVIANLPSSGTGRDVYVVDESRDAWPWMAGLVLQLERRGVPAKVAGSELMVGPRRSVETVPPRSAIVTIADRTSVGRYRADPKQREVGSTPRVVAFLAVP